MDDSKKKYIALLRGINIGGKNKIAMADLKKELTGIGFEEVITYLNSGNVVFSTDIVDVQEIRRVIEELIQTKLGLTVPVWVIPYEKLQQILDCSPSWWGTDNQNQYDNLIFILTGEKSEDIAELIGPVSEGLEKVACVDDVFFWTFDRKQYQKCNWWKKTASAGIAEKLTIRTANTIYKMLK